MSGSNDKWMAAGGVAFTIFAIGFVGARFNDDIAWLFDFERSGTLGIVIVIALALYVLGLGIWGVIALRRRAARRRASP